MIGKDELAEAARYNDAQSEDFGDADKVLTQLGLDTEGVFHVSRQRAMRSYALFTRQLKNFIAGKPLANVDQDVLNMVTISVLDGISISARAFRNPNERLLHAAIAVLDSECGVQSMRELADAVRDLGGGDFTTQ